MTQLRRRFETALPALLSLFSYSLVFSGEPGAFAGFRLPEPVFLLLSLSLIPLAKRTPRPGATARACGLFFGCFTLIGRAFFDPDWDYFLLRHDWPHLLGYAAALPGFAVAWTILTGAAFRFLDGAHAPGGGGRIGAFLDRKPFLFPFLMLCALHLPSVILCWPGIACPGDTLSQVRMAMGDTVLSNHHPVLHTLLLRLFLRGGESLFASASVGLGCFTLLQALFTLACFALAIRRLFRRGVSPGIRLALILYLGLNPGISNLLLVVTKDVPYAAFLLLFLLACESAARGEEGRLLPLCASALGTLLFRSEGKYVCLVSALLFALLLPDRRRKRVFGAAALFVAAASVLYSRALLPAVGAEPGSLREALSVPFQQTARFFVGHGDEVTEEERRIIGEVLDTDRLVEFYRPNTVDGIKFPTFLITGRQAYDYLLCWAKMGLRHPLTYLDAFLELNNQYLYRTQRRGNTYTSENSRYAFESIFQFTGVSLSYPPALNGARQRFETLRSALLLAPGVRLFAFPATFVWLSIASALYFAGKNKTAFALSLLPLFLVCFFFLGPTDGTSFRYAYPLACLWPFVFLLARKSARAAEISP